MKWTIRVEGNVINLHKQRKQGYRDEMSLAVSTTYIR